MDWAGWLRVAYRIAAAESHDPSTKNAAILIARDGTPPMTLLAWNRFPSGVEERTYRWTDRFAKNRYVEHAERAVIYAAAKAGYCTAGSTMVAPFAACCPCARAIIGAGIKRLVTDRRCYERTTDAWRVEIDIGLDMLMEAGVEVIALNESIGGVTHRINGVDWQP